MVILKVSSYAPPDFGGESPKKQRFLKWRPSVPGENEIAFCGAILTNKRSILTISDMGIPFLTFFVP